MDEKCMVAASLAVLLCHPKSTIKCFSPKPKTSSPKGAKVTPHHLNNLHNPSSKFSKKQQENITRNIAISDCPTHQMHQVMPVVTKCTMAELKGRKSSLGALETILRKQWHPKKNIRIETAFKLYHSDEVMSRFEEFRQGVISKANDINGAHNPDNERLKVDGNEILCYRGATVVCNLGVNGNSRICNEKRCSACRLIRRTWSSSLHDIDCLSLSETSWRAHKKAARKCELYGASARKVIVICRAILGVVANSYSPLRSEGDFCRNLDDFDSFSLPRSDHSKEIVVLNSTSVLPCFVIVYDVC